MTSTSTTLPTASVSEVHAAVRELLPLYGDGNGGYLISVNREERGVRVVVERMLFSDGMRYAGEEPVGSVLVDGPEEIPGWVAGLDVPRCSCCGEIVTKPGKRHVGGARYEGGGMVKKEFCSRGHALEGDNLYIRRNGKTRECRKCREIRHREAKQRAKGA